MSYYIWVCRVKLEDIQSRPARALAEDAPDCDRDQDPDISPPMGQPTRESRVQTQGMQASRSALGTQDGERQRTQTWAAEAEQRVQSRFPFSLDLLFLLCAAPRGDKSFHHTLACFDLVGANLL